MFHSIRMERLREILGIGDASSNLGAKTQSRDGGPNIFSSADYSGKIIKLQNPGNVTWVQAQTVPRSKEISG